VSEFRSKSSIFIPILDYRSDITGRDKDVMLCLLTKSINAVCSKFDMR
jgi:hypothetical protein